ncbi:MAG: flagellar export chaperone FliS [Gallionellaceae bacterium]|nr:MAG: flagellar export chaperone FliS [Gallionellaceae bacterium]
MNTSAAVKAYTNVEIESKAHSSDPHKLILMLYQGALLSVAAAKNQMLRKEIAAKGHSISQAISIINEGLKASLDLNVGGPLAKNLSDLYDYMCQRLFQANLKNDPAILDEVSALLIDLRGAWESICQAAPRPQVNAMPPQAAAKTPLVYGRI